MLLPSGRRRSRLDTTLALSFQAGALGGAIAIAGVLLLVRMLVAPVPDAVSIATWCTFAIGATVANVATGSCPLPQNRRQIGQEVVAARRPAGALQFGAALGTGVMTYAPSCAPHVLAAAIVLVPGPITAPIAGAIGFGVGRSIGLFGRALARDRPRFDDRFGHLVSPLQRGVACVAVSLLIGAWLLTMR